MTQALTLGERFAPLALDCPVLPGALDANARQPPGVTAPVMPSGREAADDLERIAILSTN